MIGRLLILGVPSKVGFGKTLTTTKRPESGEFRAFSLEENRNRLLATDLITQSLKRRNRLFHFRA